MAETGRHGITDPPLPGQNDFRLTAAITAIAFANRAPLAGIGPLIVYIRNDLGLSAAAAGLINTLLLIMFSLTALLAGPFAAARSDRKIISLGIVLNLSGALIRTFLGAPGLFVGTVLIGCGIGLMNVQLPVVVRNCFPYSVGRSMGAYTVALMASSVIGVAVVIPVMNLTGHWKYSLFLIALLTLPGLFLWISLSRQNTDSPGIQTIKVKQPGRLKTHIIRRYYLPLSLFMGAQGMLFFSFTMWLPSILTARNRQSSDAALLLITAQIASLPTSLICGNMVQRFRKKWMIVLLGSAGFLAGFFLIFPARGNALFHLAGVLFLGLGNGLMFAMPLALISLSGQNRAETAQISAFVQATGYLIAATGPVLLGFLYDLTQNWNIPVISLFAGLILMLLSGLCSTKGYPPTIGHNLREEGR